MIETSLLKMETVESFYDFLNKIGAPNCLGIGIALILLYLLLSGLWKGIKGGGKEGESDPQED